MSLGAQTTANATRSATQPTDVTIVALLLGDVAQLADAARQWLFDLSYYAERDARRTPILLVVDGPEWHAWLTREQPTRPSAHQIVFPTTSHHPGRMCNRALEQVETTWFCVMAVGSEVSTWYVHDDERRTALATTHEAMQAGYRSDREGRSEQEESWLVHQSDGFSSDYPHAWLQMLDLVPMTNSMLRSQVARALGGFTEAPALQRMWWWEWCQRLSARTPIRSLPLQPAPGTRWSQFAFAQDTAATVDAMLPRLMQRQSEPRRCLPAREDELREPVIESNTVLTTKSAVWRQLPAGLRHHLYLQVEARSRPLRIAVLGGVNEPAHNQLCFFNYFELLYDTKLIEWRSMLDVRGDIEELVGYDLVIFSRVRSAHGASLMQACRARGIRTLYMLDDNWFWLGREWDEYAPYFTPGKPDYENFLSCVQAADTTLTYSQPLADDLAPYARRLVLLSTNVNLQVFKRTPRGRLAPQGGQRVRIGYVGSLRRNMLAFDALVDVARGRGDVELFVMSNSLPEEFASLGDRVLYEPYQFNYAAYAATVRRMAPDVLVAPVNRSRFEASKCPNKYLEISACGAAGVYSRAEPYLSFVTEGKTGLFADDTRESWRDAIERLVDDTDLRSRIIAQANAHVREQFDTPAMLPRFLRMLVDAASS
jgi:glycosyltransferase involved in cell wall biosynthesis